MIYYTILFYTKLYQAILYYTILYYTIPYYTILYYTVLGAAGPGEYHDSRKPDSTRALGGSKYPSKAP